MPYCERQEVGRSLQGGKVIRVTLRSERPQLTQVRRLVPYKCRPALAYGVYGVSPCAVLHSWACESPGESSALFGGS